MPLAGQQSPWLPWDSESWGKGCDACSPTPSQEAATEPLLPQRTHSSLVDRCPGISHASIIRQLSALPGSKVAMKSKQQPHDVFPAFVRGVGRTTALPSAGVFPRPRAPVPGSSCTEDNHAAAQAHAPSSALCAC